LVRFVSRQIEDSQLPSRKIILGCKMNNRKLKTGCDAASSAA